MPGNLLAQIVLRPKQIAITMIYRLKGKWLIQFTFQLG